MSGRTILPVWVRGWQLSCCGSEHVAEVGRPWRETLLLESTRWEPTRDRSLGWTSRDDGSIRFVAGVRNSDEPTRATQPILDLGACQVGGPGIRAEWLVTGDGNVHADWHVGFDDPARAGLVVVEGVVRRIRALVAVHEPAGESQPRLRRFAGYRPPEDVDRMDRWRDPSRDALIDLEIGARAP